MIDRSSLSEALTQVNIAFNALVDAEYAIDDAKRKMSEVEDLIEDFLDEISDAE